MNCTELSNLAIGKRIKTLREQHGETQVDLKKAIGLSKREYLSKYESGSNAISCYNLALIAQHYGVSTDYLLGLTDIPAPDTSIRGVVESTGLSENAVSSLIAVQQFNGLKETGTVLLNAFIENEHFKTLIRAFQQLFLIKLNADTKFHYDKRNAPPELFNEQLERDFALSRSDLAKISFVNSAEQIVREIMQEIENEENGIQLGNPYSKYLGAFMQDLENIAGGGQDNG